MIRRGGPGPGGPAPGGPGPGGPTRRGGFFGGQGAAPAAVVVRAALLTPADGQAAEQPRPAAYPFVFTDVTESGADAHIDSLAKKYLGQDKYPYRKPGEVRVIYKIAPERVQVMG